MRKLDMGNDPDGDAEEMDRIEQITEPEPSTTANIRGIRVMLDDSGNVAISTEGNLTAQDMMVAWTMIMRNWMRFMDHIESAQAAPAGIVTPNRAARRLHLPGRN